MIKKKINEVIDEKIRPYLAKHGGDLEVAHVKNGVVEINLLGQCKHCLSSDDTVKEVIEAALIKEIPEIKKVKVENQVNEELLNEARKILNK
ncbi:MAG: NifU family protein [Eubacteriales bacterium]